MRRPDDGNGFRRDRVGGRMRGRVVGRLVPGYLLFLRMLRGGVVRGLGGEWNGEQSDKGDDSDHAPPCRTAMPWVKPSAGNDLALPHGLQERGDAGDLDGWQQGRRVQRLRA
jgi:hypothetical protein